MINTQELEKAQFKIQALSAHEIPLQKAGSFIADQEAELQALRITEGINSDVAVHKHDSGLYMIRKQFGLKRQFSPAVLAELAADYQPHVRALRKAGVSNLADNYNLRVDPENSTISVDQLFLPYGTVLDWMREGIRVEELTNHILDTHILPILSYTEPHLSSVQSGAYIDSTFKNFAAQPQGESVNAYYFDFFPPRVRNTDGTIKKFPHHALEDRFEDEEVEYRFFTKPGLVHNFLRRNTDYLLMEDTPGKEQIAERFLSTAAKKLQPYIDRFFPHTSVSKLINTPFNAYVDKFVTPHETKPTIIYQI